MVRTHDFAGIRAGEVDFGDKDELEVRVTFSAGTPSHPHVAPQRARGAYIFDSPAIQMRAKQLAEADTKDPEADSPTDGPESIPLDNRTKRQNLLTPEENALIDEETDASPSEG